MTENVFCVGAATAACQEGSSMRQYSSTGTTASRRMELRQGACLTVDRRGWWHYCAGSWFWGRLEKRDAVAIQQVAEEDQ